MKKRDYLSGLTGLRGLAALMVVFSHGSFHGMNAIDGLNLDGMGKLGVFVFFVLSSFLLTKGLLQRVRAPREMKKSLKVYFLRRFMRIYPVYIVAVLVNYIVSISIGSFYVDSVTSVVEHLLLLDGCGTFWTIPVEFGFYFILPFVVLLFIAWRDRPILVLSSIISFIAVWQVIYEPAYHPEVAWFLSVFLLGALAAFIHHYLIERHSDILSSRVFRTIAAWVAFGCLFALFLMIPLVYSWLSGAVVARDHFHYRFIQLGVLSSLLVFGVVCSSGVIKRFFETRVMIFFGNISYSLYIWHIFVANAVKRIPVEMPMLSFYLYFLISALVATLSYRWFEKPFFAINSIVEARAKLPLLIPVKLITQR